MKKILIALLMGTFGYLAASAVDKEDPYALYCRTTGVDPAVFTRAMYEESLVLQEVRDKRAAVPSLPDAAAADSDDNPPLYQVAAPVEIKDIPTSKGFTLRLNTTDQDLSTVTHRDGKACELQTMSVPFVILQLLEDVKANTWYPINRIITLQVKKGLTIHSDVQAAEQIAQIMLEVTEMKRSPNKRVYMNRWTHGGRKSNPKYYVYQGEEVYESWSLKVLLAGQTLDKATVFADNKELTEHDTFVRKFVFKPGVESDVERPGTTGAECLPDEFFPPTTPCVMPKLPTPEEVMRIHFEKHKAKFS